MGKSNYKMYVLGSRGTHSAFGDDYKEFGGQTSCYVIKNDNYAIIVDCGSGLYSSKELLKDCSKIDILITHVHYDHIIGLLDSNCFPQNADINFYGNFDKWSKDNVFDDYLKYPFWPLNTIKGNRHATKEDGTKYTLNSDIYFMSYPSNHGSDTSVFVININGENICIMSDYSDKNPLDISYIKGCKYLLYDGTFEYEDSIKYIDYGHSSWNKGCKIAKELNIKNLLITHHNPNSNDETLKRMEKECQNEFPNSRFLRVNDIIEL